MFYVISIVICFASFPKSMFIANFQFKNTIETKEARAQGVARHEWSRVYRSTINEIPLIQFFISWFLISIKYSPELIGCAAPKYCNPAETLMHRLVAFILYVPRSVSEPVTLMVYFQYIISILSYLI